MAKKKIIILIALILIAGLAYFIYQKMHNSGKGIGKISINNQLENNAPNNTISNEKVENNKAPDNINSVGNQNSGNSEITTSPININSKNSGPDKNVAANITTEHCDTNCKAFANDLKLFEYCQAVCGLKPSGDTSNCENKKDLEIDYCFKDLAIQKTDPSICDKVSDSNLKEACKNRITEDIIENQ